MYLLGRATVAGVAKLADAPDLGSGAARRGGSSPSTRTTLIIICFRMRCPWPLRAIDLRCNASLGFEPPTVIRRLVAQFSARASVLSANCSAEADVA